MFPRVILFSSVLFAVTAALPADTSSVIAVVNQNAQESSFPLFHLFKPIIDMFPNFSDIGPKIEIGDTYTNVIVKAKNYKVEDLSVRVKGKFVILEGNRKTVDGDRDLSTEFLYTTTLPNNINSNDVFAKYYSDGYLVVTTPNEGAKGVYEDRTVPIVLTEAVFIKPSKPVEIETTQAPVTSENVPVDTTVVAETTEAAEKTTEVQTEAPEEVIIQNTTTESPEVPTEGPVVTQNESKETKDVESTTPYIEIQTVDTTPYVVNEISDVEPISDQN